MKPKTLRKKIKRLEKKLREGPAKLARMKRELRDLEARKEVTARARETEGAGEKAAKSPRKAKATANPKPADKRSRAKRAAARPRRILNLSPERRAQLAEAMRARWAAKRAANSNSVTGQPAEGGPSSDGALPWQGQ